MTKPLAWGINFEIIQGEIVLDIKYVSNIYLSNNYLFDIYLYIFMKSRVTSDMYRLHLHIT